MKNLHRFIEHTQLAPTTQAHDIDRLVREAREHQFLGVCVPPFWVKKARREIGPDDIRLVTVIGFPLGYNMTETKLEEMNLAIRDGAQELDLVMNVSALKSEMPWVKIEMAKAAQLAHDNDCLLKVIIETAYLNEKELELACRWSAAAGVDFVKTSTGFAPEGAKEEIVRQMRALLPSNVGIKASGGIRTHEQALALLKAGADRLGASAGAVLLSPSSAKQNPENETY